MSKQPKYDVSVPVYDEAGELVRWMKIGAAWDGTKPGSILIALDALPLTSRVYLFVREAPPWDKRRKPRKQSEVVNQEGDDTVDEDQGGES